jgi:hypothetical protein
MTGKMNKPRVLVLRCESCGRRVGSHRAERRSGYIKIDRASLVCESVNGWTGEKIWWHVLHEECDKDQKTTDFRLAANRLSTTGDLLECTAWLLRNRPELIAGSNWHGLIGKVMADTREFADLLQDTKHMGKNERRRDRDGRKRNGSDTITAVLDRDDNE